MADSLLCFDVYAGGAASQAPEELGLLRDAVPMPSRDALRQVPGTVQGQRWRSPCRGQSCRLSPWIG